MRHLAPWVALVGFSLPLAAQDSIHFVPADRVAVRVMREVPPIDVAPGLHVRTVVGSTGSFSLADFDAGGVAPVHHHTREQADVGISGVFDVTLGNHIEPVGPGAGVIIPPNVTHSIANVRGGVMTIIEFHTGPAPGPRPSSPNDDVSRESRAGSSFRVTARLWCSWTSPTASRRALRRQSSVKPPRWPGVASRRALHRRTSRRLACPVNSSSTSSGAMRDSSRLEANNAWARARSSSFQPPWEV